MQNVGGNPELATTCILQVYIEGPSLLAADSEEEPSSDEGSDVEDNRPSLLPLDVSCCCTSLLMYM